MTIECNNEPKSADIKDDGSSHHVQRRREFTQRLKNQRQIYREITSYRVFPLQEMAVNDFDERIRDYLSGSVLNEFEPRSFGDEGETVDSLDDIIATKLMLGNASATGAEVNGNFQKTDVPDSCLKDEGETAFSEIDSTATKSILESALETTVCDRDIKRNISDPHSNRIRSLELLKDQFLRLMFLDKPSAEDVVYPHGITCDKVPIDSAVKVAENGVASIRAVRSNDQNDLCPSGIDAIQLQSVDLDISNQDSREEVNPPQQSQLLRSSDSSCPDIAKIDNTAVYTNPPTLWSMEPRIFAMETASKGKRRYISSHLGRFMDHYWRECDVHSRHYYELIRENTPCRLYFDLEFSKISNQELTSDITEDLLTEFFNEIQRQFQALHDLSVQRHNVVDLDSSTNKKFSRHWIVHLPNGELFPDARAVGVFVKSLMSRLEKGIETGELKKRGHELLVKYLFINAEDSEDGNVKLTRFVDLGVYTRNRLFRLMGSTKFGKRAEAALRIAESNQFQFPERFCNSKFYLPEMSTSTEASTGDENNAQNNTDDLDFESFCNSLNWEDHATALEQTFVVPACNATKNRYPLLNIIPYDFDQRPRVLNPATDAHKFLRSTVSYGSSPLPLLENFVMETLAQRQGLRGRIGTFSLVMPQPLPRMISFSMKGNRFCENIGRAHKSNNIIWNFHLIDRVGWQSCHDPECRGFRGKYFDLPEEINSEIDEYFLDHELSSLNESLIAGNVSKQDEESPSGRNEFDDPLLEEAMRKLDISSL